jgi:hypothetical protein
VRKSLSEFLIDFVRQAKGALVRVLNFVVPVYRDAQSYVRLVFGLAETTFLGYWHALLVHKNGAAPDTLVITHAVSNNPGDRERFLVQFANAISENPDCKDIDVTLLANHGQPVTTYSAVARMFGRRLNLQIFTGAQTLADVGNMATETSGLQGQCSANAKSVKQIPLTEKAVGCLRPPLLSKNTAREYLKSIDPASRFCAVSFPADGRPMDVKAMLAKLVKRNPGWCFVLLNDLIAIGGSADELPPGILFPARAGFDFLTRLCLAIEADAYIGPADVFGLTAYLAIRPAYLLERPNSPVMIVATSPKPHEILDGAYRVPASEVERLASDLFGANVQSLKNAIHTWH